MNAKTRRQRKIITSGTKEGHRDTVEVNVSQRTVDYPDDWANGYHVMLDS